MLSITIFSQIEIGLINKRTNLLSHFAEQIYLYKCQTYEGGAPKFKVKINLVNIVQTKHTKLFGVGIISDKLADSDCFLGYGSYDNLMCNHQN